MTGGRRGTSISVVSMVVFQGAEKQNICWGIHRRPQEFFQTVPSHLHHKRKTIAFDAHDYTFGNRRFTALKMQY